MSAYYTGRYLDLDTCLQYHIQSINPTFKKDLTIYVHTTSLKTLPSCIYINILDQQGNLSQKGQSFLSCQSIWLYVVLYDIKEKIGISIGYYNYPELLGDDINRTIFKIELSSSLSTTPLCPTDPSYLLTGPGEKQCSFDQLQSSFLSRLRYYIGQDFPIPILDRSSSYIDHIGWMMWMFLLCHHCPQKKRKQIISFVISREVDLFRKRINTCWAPWIYELFCILLTMLEIPYQEKSSWIGIPFESLLPMTLMKQRKILIQNGYAWLQYGHLFSSIHLYYEKYLIMIYHTHTYSPRFLQDERVTQELLPWMNRFLRHKIKEEKEQQVITVVSLEQVKSNSPACVHRFLHVIEKGTKYKKGSMYYLNNNNLRMLLNVLLNAGMQPDILEKMLHDRTQKVYPKQEQLSQQKYITGQIKWASKNLDKQYGCYSLIKGGWCPYTNTSADIEDLGGIMNHREHPQTICANKVGIPSITRPSDYIKQKMTMTSTLSTNPYPMDESHG